MSKHVLAIVFNIYYIVKYKFSSDLTLKYKKKKNHEMIKITLGQS